MIKLYYFTSTGNSLYVAKEISKKCTSKLVNIKDIINNKNYIEKDEVIGIIYPLHCFGLPIIVEEFLRSLKIEGNPYIFAVQVTGGGASNNGFLEINNILASKGLKLNNFEEVKYISNYTRAGRNPNKDRAIEAIEHESEKLNKFIEYINNREIKKVSLNKQILSKFVHKMWKDKYKKKDKNFISNSNCIGCNICKNICPVDNIEVKDKKVIWKGKCIDCMACINICPKKAINIGTKTVKKDRYINPYIKVDELI
ncbi:EFR1 family ferrodoxin [Clostridium sp. Ade.TY]|uniref:EFR1 family ferrodoxin n=1 Tax=Clostridium sp. Ade.TY TaxID=1391647 RepID=UPI0004252569|nr:EFR1 family ferrodoxin [Clostridium sp. Ade.TY]